MKRFLLTTHRWLGLISGIFLLAIGGSGSILVYKHEIDRLLHPALYNIDSSGTRLTLDSLYAIVFARHGEGFASLSFDIPTSADTPVEFTLSSRGGNFYEIRHYIVDVHPYTGAILREGDCADISTSFVHWIMYVHDGARFGNTGMLVVALCALIMFLSGITGLFYYGKRLRSILTFPLRLRGLNASQFLRSLHVYVAVWSILLTLVVFFTGFWMAKGIFTGGRWGTASHRKSERIAVSISACLATSSAILPGFSPDFVDVPLREGGFIEIDGETNARAFFGGGDASSVTFDPRTGGLLGAVDERSASFPGNIIPAFWALHVGSYGGAFIKMLYAIFGLVPGVLAISGFVMCRTR